MRFVAPEEAREALPAGLGRADARSAPACSSARRTWWELRRLRMPDEEKANPRRFAALELDGSVQGYAVYRQFPAWEDGSTSARLEVSR